MGVWPIYRCICCEGCFDIELLSCGVVNRKRPQTAVEMGPHEDMDKKNGPSSSFFCRSQGKDRGCIIIVQQEHVAFRFCEQCMHGTYT